MRFRVAAFAVVFSAWPALHARELDLEQRIAAQRAIEQIYWSHRIWPADNPGAKPPLETVLSEADLRAKVEDYLTKSRALEELWQRPITGEQLQAELERMAARTRDAQVLRELFAALEDDPQLIAETLARQTLVERLIRSWSEPDSDQTFDTWWSAERGKLGRPSAVLVEPPPSGYVLPASPVVGCTDNTWSPPMPTEVPDPRAKHTAVWTGSEMIVWGGTGSGGGRYTPATDTWVATSTGANTPSARMNHTAVWTGSEMIVWGGEAAGALNTGGRYNPSTNTWVATSILTNVPSARTSHTAIWTGTVMIVWGGWDFVTATDTGGRYNPSTDSWATTSTAGAAPSARFGHTAVWASGAATPVMIVWGGYSGGGMLFNNGARYNPTTNNWTATSVGANVPDARYLHTAVWTGSAMIVWGGGSSSLLNTGGRYTLSSNSWTATSTGANVPAGRAEHLAVWTGSVMIVWGGSGGNTGGRYNPSADTWAATSTGANVPSSRPYASAVWTGSEMIVWGGGHPFASNDGGRYSPTSDTWVPTSTGATVPGARYGHTAVWTGSEMVAWGGTRQGANVNTGGMYVPATDSWTPTSTGAHLPEARTNHTAVWNGRSVIVWGGGGTPFLDSGGRFDPATNAWLATSSTGAPAGRSFHTAVWSGKEMIVWGGANPNPVNTGGRYDPAADTWAATSEGTNVPTARSNHTAVWTGTRMIVWGGSKLNSGGRYDPVGDSWETTSTGANVPQGRFDHVAQWTGSKMIVWGGRGGEFDFQLATGGRYDLSEDTWETTAVAPIWAGEGVWTGSEMIVWGGGGNWVYNTGARYNPVANSWSTTATGANVPQARREHTLVWSGTEMIVWGGAPDTATGGRYCACSNPATYYRDLDGDGFGGEGAVTTSACLGSAPAGWVANNTDCDDAAAQVHPGAPELCNGLDDDCDDVADEGFAVPEAPVVTADPTELQWASVVPSTGYDVVRGDLGQLLAGAGDFEFAAVECVAEDSAVTSFGDPDEPTPGAAYWYLVRAVNCEVAGTWDSGGAGQQGSRDAEIAAAPNTCAP